MCFPYFYLAKNFSLETAFGKFNCFLIGLKIMYNDQFDLINLIPNELMHLLEKSES